MKISKLGESTKIPPPIENPTHMLERAYDYFNRELFGGTLPFCIVVPHRLSNSYGYTGYDRYVTLDNGTLYTELSVNPDYFDRGDIRVFSTLVHEQVHHWQHYFGEPGRGGYHNKEWSEKMKEIGLYPSNTGLPGGKETGDRMTHYIIANGPYEKAFAGLNEHINVTDAWMRNKTPLVITPLPPNVDPTIVSNPPVPKTKGAKNKKNKVKYQCPVHNDVILWGKRGVLVMCGICGATLVYEDDDE